VGVLARIFVYCFGLTEDKTDHFERSADWPDNSGSAHSSTGFFVRRKTLNDIRVNAANKLVADAKRVLWEEIQDALQRLQSDRGLIVASKVENDFGKARDHFADLVSTIDVTHNAAPYITGWYILSGAIVSSVEEQRHGIILHISSSSFNSRDRGIAFIGSLNEELAERPVQYDFCDVWCELNKSTKSMYSHCKQRSLGDLVPVLTAVYIISYTDEYFWTIYNAPGLKQSVRDATKRYTGFTAEQISELRRHWETCSNIHS
jgi:hypothetical protein